MPVLRIFKIVIYYIYDAIRFIRHSNTFAVNSTQSRITADLIFKSHMVEKGLTMPSRRWNFGHDNIVSLIVECNTFINKYGAENDELRCAVGVLRAYVEEHVSHGIDVPEHISAKIVELSSRLPDVLPIKQKRLTKQEYFKHSNADFVNFSRSRASVRNYTDNIIPIDVMKRAIEIAKTAPSACNRQATRVYVIQKREMVDGILLYQNGSSGFGHLADTLLVLTSAVSSFQGIAERKFGWIDCGIFALNLMYSLFSLQIGCCPLNAGLSIFDQMMVRKICKIPVEEDLCLFITCGYLPDTIDLANSQRKRTEDIMRIR